MKGASFSRLGLIALLLAVCTACTDIPAMDQVGEALGITSTAPQPPDPKTQMAALELRIEDLIEQKRLEINPNAKVLTMDAQLVDIARKRSADMAEKKYLANTSPDGDTSASILMAQDEQFQGLLGENVAAQYYVPETGIDVEAFAQRFVESWLNSPRHKENLAFTEYNRTGVGAAVNGDTVYVTQLFATDLGMGRYDPAKQPLRPIVSLPNPQASQEKAPVPPAQSVPLRGLQETPTSP